MQLTRSSSRRERPDSHRPFLCEPSGLREYIRRYATECMLGISDQHPPQPRVRGSTFHSSSPHDISTSPRVEIEQRKQSNRE